MNWSLSSSFAKDVEAIELFWLMKVATLTGCNRAFTGRFTNNQMSKELSNLYVAKPANHYRASRIVSGIAPSIRT